MSVVQYKNPFKPTAGKMPPVLVGRETVIDDFIEGMANGEGAPGRLMRITGPRGSGKTVLLSERASIAEEQGWMVVNVAADGGLLASIGRKLRHQPLFNEIAVKVQAPIASLELRHDATERDGFERLIDEAAHAMTRQGRGLMVTIDEVQDASIDDLRVIANAVQLLIRDEQNIAFIFAGITTGVMDILNGKSLTFLRRAKPEELDAIPLDEVEESLKLAIERSGFTIDDDALAAATRATEGYAFLIQLVGYHVWRAAWARVRRDEGDGSIVIGIEDARSGISSALDEFERAVLETAISDLPKTAIEFILAMSEMPDVVSTGDIARRLGKSTGYLSPYRRRLMAQQVIEQTAPGYVTFSIPFMKGYLKKKRAEILARYGG